MPNVPKTITVTESEKLLEQFEFDTAPERKIKKLSRNKCMILLMLDAGLRVGEVVKLHRNCLCVFNQPANAVVVPPYAAKNHKQRIIPLTDRLRQAIKMMQSHIWMPDATGLEENAFYSDNPVRSLSKRQVQRMVADNSLRAFGRAIHPHVLRHTFGTRLMRIANARMVQELLGHSSLATTQIYTHPDADDLKLVIKNLDTKNCEP